MKKEKCEEVEMAKKNEEESKNEMGKNCVHD